VSRGHSCRGGRSRCTSKIGPSSRAHRSKAVVRRQSIRAAEDGAARQVQVQVQIPNLARCVSPFAGTELRGSDPIFTSRQIGGRTVECADFSGDAI